MDDGTVEFRVSLIASRTPGDGKKRDMMTEWRNTFKKQLPVASERGVVVVVAVRKLLVVAYCWMRFDVL